MLYTRTLNFVFSLSHLVVNISTTNIDKTVSVVLSQHRCNADKHTLTQL